MISKNSIAAIVLAAGLGTRMKSEIPKVLQPLLGKPVLYYPIKMCLDVGVDQLVIVIGKNKSQVEEPMAKIFPEKNLMPFQYALQDPPLGTAHAVQMGLKKLSQFSGDILIVNGDLSLMSVSAIESLARRHQEKEAAVSFVTAVLERPVDYGRVRRDHGGNVVSVIEAKDATDEQKMIREINVGVYLITSSFLKERLKDVSTENKQSEFYLPDLVAMAVAQGLRVETFVLSDSQEGLGINNQEELAHAVKVMSARSVKRLMDSGVRMIHPDSILVEPEVKVGADTVIYGPCHLLGKTKIGSACTIETGNWIQDSVLGNRVHVKSSSYLTECEVGDDASIGPMAHLRPATVLKNKTKVGNFVEIKKSTVGEGSKVNHLTYIGDAKIGKDVNVGAGTITCNYDGTHKHETIIEDGVFIGSDSQLVAPVKIGKGAYIGSGSTITKNVSPDSLALTRASQTEIKGWAKKK